MFYNSTILMMK